MATNVALCVMDMKISKSFPNVCSESVGKVQDFNHWKHSGLFIVRLVLTSHV